MAVKDYYEQYWTEDGAGCYPDLYLDPQLRRILEAHVSRNSRCLDVGCGTGETCGLWLNEHAGSYVGVDISEHAVNLARGRGLDARVIADATELPFPDNTFDVVVCTEVLEHLFDPGIAASEILRVLRPGGILIATVPNAVYWRRRLDFLAGHWDPAGSYEPPWQDPHLRFFTRRSLAKMLAYVGFQPTHTSGHMGAFMADLPYASEAKRRLLRTRLGNNAKVVSALPRRRSSQLYRILENASPSVFAFRLHAIAQKPL